MLVDEESTNNDSDARDHTAASHSVVCEQESSIPQVTRSIQKTQEAELEEREEADCQHTEGDKVPSI